MVVGYKVLLYIHNKHDKERIGLAYCPCAHSLTPGSTTSEHYREKAVCVHDLEIL